MHKIINDTNLEIDFNRDKLTKSLIHHSRGLSDVSAMQITLNTTNKLRAIQSIDELIDTIIQVCEILDDDSCGGYDILAGRIYLKRLNKKLGIINDNTSLLAHVKKMISMGYYSKTLLRTDFDEMSWVIVAKHLKVNKERAVGYKKIAEDVSKFCLTDYKTGLPLETPHIARLLISVSTFIDEQNNRINNIENLYKNLTLGAFSFSPEIMKTLRTPSPNFISEAIIDTEDNINSINSAASSVVHLSSNSTPVSVNTGRLRSKGASIQNGRMRHAGVLPVHNFFYSAMQAFTSVDGVGGEARFFVPFWHADVLDVLNESRYRKTNQVGYCIQVSKIFYTRALKGQDIHLFSPEVSTELYELFTTGSSKFDKMYLKLEKDPSVLKRKVPALDLLSKVVFEFEQGGSFSFQNVDICNATSSFKSVNAPIRASSSSLLANIPSIPMVSINDSKGEIGHLFRSTVDYQLLKGKGMGTIIRNLVLAMDNIIDKTVSFGVSSENSIRGRRNLGVDLINTPYISDEFTYYDLDKVMRDFQCELLRASSTLKEYKLNSVSASKLSECAYLDNGFPKIPVVRTLDTYMNHSSGDEKDWARLSNQIKSGLSHSTVSSGSSSDIEINRMRQYQPEDYLMEVAIKQKYLDNNAVFHLLAQPKINSTINLILKAYKMGIRVVNLVRR